ncbi:3-keto-disaccharide hydrolase [Pedobacter sp. 22226]|uniref:3-keto-disaccharide hydrolase n=1 Tax=Pedobacter sp. 22226 TaxID=3453894 RepID=UPI003F868078
MNINVSKTGFTAIIWLCGTLLAFGQRIDLKDLSAFKNPSNSWSLAQNVVADLNAENVLKTTKGEGILVNQSTAKKAGADLYTVNEYGDVAVELDYLTAKGTNSGIYLQGNYEIQIDDAWGLKNATSSNNGGIYQRWDDSKPEADKGFGGVAPRQNASKAPGLWQHIKIIFKAPKFDASGTKTQNAKIISVELNGVLIHENVELFGATRGAAGAEKAKGPLRLQGDHGSVAFKNISITELSDIPKSDQRGGADPIYIEAASNNMIRSFVDVVPGVRSVHAISVGGPEKTAYSYDLDNGTLLQGWHGNFVDATPMWDGRGNGTSRPLGSITRFTKKPVLAIAKLANDQAAWIADTAGTGFRTKGYIMDKQDRPEFKYIINGAQVTDAIKVMENGQGLTREITINKPSKDLYFLLATASNIEEAGKGLYLIDDKAYYIQLGEGTAKPIIRNIDGKWEIIAAIGTRLNYTILF